VASSFSGSLLATFQASYSNSNALSTPTDPPVISQKNTYTNGGAALQATKLAYAQLTFTPAQTQTLDLSSLTDPFGVVFTLVGVGVKGLVFFNTTITAGSWFTVAPGASNGWIVTASGVNYGVFSASTQKIFFGAGGKLILEAPTDSFQVPDNTHSKIDIYSQLAATLNYCIWG
jgi:hypothetical protein